MSSCAGHASSSVVEFFCEVGVRNRLTPSGPLRKDTAETALLTTAFEPSVLVRLPANDRAGSVQFPPEVAMFVFPHGVRLCTPDEAAYRAIPVVTSFVLTAVDQSRMYGACIVWYEELSADVVNALLVDLDLTAAHAAVESGDTRASVALLDRAT